MVDNSAGTFAFQGTNTFDAGNNTAVYLENNDGATIQFDHLDATASGANTFVVQGGGTISVANDPNNPGSIANTGSGTAMFVRGDASFDGDPNMSIEVDITNSGGGMSVDIADVTGGGITFTGMIDDTDGGILLENNSGGTFLFTEMVTVDTSNNDAVSLINNSGATISFNGLELMATGAGNKGFTATGGGDLTVTNSNPTTISTDIDTALELDGMTINAANVTFDRVEMTAGTADGIILKDLTGPGMVSIGSGTDPNTGSMITTTATGIRVDNVASAVVNNVTVDSSAVGANGVNVTGQGASSVATFNDVRVMTTTGDAVTVENNTDGVIAFNDLDATSTTGNAVMNTDNSGATISYSELTATTTAGTGDTFLVQGGGSVTVTDTGSGSMISNTGGGNALVVQGDDPGPGDFDGDPNVTISADIDNTSGGLAASIRRMSGGRVTINGTITGDADGILIEDNTGGTINVNGMVTLNTGATHALVIQDNGSGSTVNFNASSQLDIDTTSGNGIVLDGPGTVNIDGTGNTIDTTTGVGISATNVGNATINNTTINTTGSDAVDVLHNDGNASRLTLNSVTVASAGDVGVDVLADGGGEFNLVMDNVDISGVGQEGILFDTGANADRVDFTITDSLVTAGDDEALLATLDDSNSAEVRFLIVDNQFSNNSGSADSDAAAVDILVSSGMTLNATVGNGPDDPNNPPSGAIGDRNRFVNTSADGDAFLIEVDHINGVLNLDLRDNTAQSGGIEFGITETNGTFQLVDFTDTDAGVNNVGTITNSGVTLNIDPPLVQPD